MDPEQLKQTIKSNVTKLLPEVVIREMRQYRTYEKGERSIYWKIRMSNALGLTPLRVPKTARSFLFVCFGNIIRSPMCEALMNRAAAGITGAKLTVTSAGLNAVPGSRAHPWAIAAAREFDISLENHRARQLTSEMVDQADVIFAMDYQNQVQLLWRWAHAKNKVFLLSGYADSSYRLAEVRDPYYLGEEETRRCYQILCNCIRNLAQSFPHETEQLTASHSLARPLT
jgi:protein-tyrosine phosphatase